MNRILWNERGKDINEIVLSDIAVVHIEQLDDRSWWIGLTLEGGKRWCGTFYSDKRRMFFTETENDGVEWDQDDTHGVAQ